MRLLVERAEMRGGDKSSPFSLRTHVIDQDTGKKVGFVLAESPPIKRHISLFGGKYQADFKDHEECEAFAKGVEAVLDRMMATDEDEEQIKPTVKRRKVAA